MKMTKSVGFPALFVSVASCVLTVQATVVDFNNIPDGTPVSAGNPYAGVLDIQAETGWVDWTPPGPDGIRQLFDVWLPALITDGKIDTNLGRARMPDHPVFGFHSRMTAKFTAPVTDVSFKGYSFVYDAAYSYTGVNNSGQTFTGHGGFSYQVVSDHSEFVDVKLTLPAGFNLTEFSVENHDTRLNYDFLIDEISFHIPDGSSTPVLLLLSCFGLMVAHRWLGAVGHTCWLGGRRSLAPRLA